MALTATGIKTLKATDKPGGDKYRDGEGKFPKPFKLGDSVTVWDAAAVEAFLVQRAGGAS